MAEQPALIANVAALTGALAADPDLEDLASTLDAIKLAVEKVWRENHQPWFTDHGPHHSRRTSEYALRLSDLPGISPDLWLTPLEAYILWAAAWLHDVGMQDLLAAGTDIGAIDAGGFARVRQQHPHRSSERILEAWGLLGLPDGDAALAQTVASVARAHGTGFYADTIATRLAGNTTVRNKPIRGRLLAALLLFADELDLHYQRARDTAGWGKDNHVSEAHKFKHRSVVAVSTIQGPGGLITVELDLKFPSLLGERDREAVQRWIEVKLRRQMSLIEPEIAEGFSGQVRLGRHIRTTASDLFAKAEPPSDAALRLVRAETARDALINHDSDLAQVIHAVANGAIVVVSDGSSDPAQDEGAEDLFTAAITDAAASGRAVYLSRRAQLSGGATAADVVGEWAAEIGQAEPPPELDEHSRRSMALAAVTRAVTEQQGPFLFALSRAQDMDPESLDWLRTDAVPALRRACGAAFVLTAGLATVFTVPDDTVVTLTLGRTDQQAAAEFLGRSVDRSVATAESRALERYSLLKRTAQYHDLQLRGEL